MGLWEISFRTRYDYPFITMSGRYPDTPMSMWCIWNRELLQVPTTNETVLRGIEADLKKAGRLVDEWVDAREGRIFMLKCTCNHLDSPWNVADAHEAIDAPPAVFRDGWGYFRVISFDESRTKDMFREFNKRGPTELIRKRELPLSVLPTSVWVNSLFADLTGKQMDAMVKAHRYGYYTSPRQITTENIAKGLGVSRSTYEEHLRKAENNVISALMPYLQLFAVGERREERMPLKRTLAEPEASEA